MKRFWILAGAAAVTLGALALAMLLGSASFDFRRYRQHQGRLEKVLREQPTADLLTRGLADEGTVLLAVAATRADVEREASTRGGKKSAEVREKGGRYPETRVYQTADMLYFIYFDAAGVMRDFTLVSR
ncbi:MAG TPA: hypothetical protein VLF95_10800 [Vicinamibacteria bacterium]|nr:hypothetical protein [Vicinamibacteria bacterium]